LLFLIMFREVRNIYPSIVILISRLHQTFLSIRISCNFYLYFLLSKARTF